MFYVKTEDGQTVEITDENVVTFCPACRREKQVDITQIDDLYSTSIYCPQCIGRPPLKVVK